jgi:predicted metal-dependent hydrolase
VPVKTPRAPQFRLDSATAHKLEWAYLVKLASTMSTEQRTVTLNGQTIPYTLRRSDKAKHARLEVGLEGGLTVIIPAHFGIDRVRPLIIKKKRWVVDKLEKYGSAESGRRAKLLTQGDILPYLGREMKIETRESGDKAGTVNVYGGTMMVCLRPGDNKLHVALEKWYREQASTEIARKVENISQVMGLSYNKVTLKGQRTLWGSCSRKHNLNFNWRLMMTPEPVIEYVVVHELAHLKEMNHSPRFWKIVEKHCPAWRERRKWLRDHSKELSRLLPA